MPDLSVLAWLALGAGALGVGFAKTAIGGVGSIAVALFAWALPARGSTGTLLLLLLVGDLVAVSIYRHDVAWRDLGRLVAPVLAGVLVGAVFLRFVSDAALKVTIGVVLLGLVALHYAKELAGKRQARRVEVDDAGSHPPELRDLAEGGGSGELAGGVGSGGAGAGSGSGSARRAERLGYGALAGFTTMVANAGGAPVALYFLAARFPMMRFLGTGAWFFFAVNVLKTPFSLALGLITRESLTICGLLLPLVLLGTWVGRVLIKRIDQSRFNTVVLVFTAISAVLLLV
jgi:uncharacterized membrane protein YfcA